MTPCKVNRLAIPATPILGFVAASRGRLGQIHHSIERPISSISAYCRFSPEAVSDYHTTANSLGGMSSPKLLLPLTR